MPGDTQTQAAPAHSDRVYIGGSWVEPSTSETITVVDSATEEPLFSVAKAGPADVDRAVAAARKAFDEGPWPRLTPHDRAAYLAKLAEGIEARADELAELWTRQSGVVHTIARGSAAGAVATLRLHIGYADSFPFEEPVQPTRGGGYGVLRREPVGVVVAIIPWNSPLGLITYKLAPALLAGNPVILKASPEAPGEAYVVADIVDSIGFPEGVVNVITADRDVSELLVKDARVDKVTFTGSSATGRRIGAILGGRLARFGLELGGKSAAVILDDADIDQAADTLAAASCVMTGQVCAALTRLIVTRDRHDALVDAVAARMGKVRVGDPFDPATQMGPLATSHHRDRVEGYIRKGVAGEATLVCGGGRPSHLDRGWYVEPTLFANVDNSSTIAQEEIFGPVLCVIPADDEDDAVRLANDSIYGLNASVFTPDAARALEFAKRLQSGTVGHNAIRGDYGIAFGGFKQSGFGREGGQIGMAEYTELKTVILGAEPTRAQSAAT